MATATLGDVMRQDKPKTLSIKLATDVVESARIVSALRDESMTDMISDLLRPVLARMEQEELARRMKETRKPKRQDPKGTGEK